MIVETAIMRINAAAADVVACGRFKVRTACLCHETDECGDGCSRDVELQKAPEILGKSWGVKKKQSTDRGSEGRKYKKDRQSRQDTIAGDGRSHNVHKEISRSRKRE